MRGSEHLAGNVGELDRRIVDYMEHYYFTQPVCWASCYNRTSSWHLLPIFQWTLSIWLSWSLCHPEQGSILGKNYEGFWSKPFDADVGYHLGHSQAPTGLQSHQPLCSRILAHDFPVTAVFWCHFQQPGSMLHDELSENAQGWRTALYKVLSPGNPTLTTWTWCVPSAGKEARQDWRDLPSSPCWSIYLPGDVVAPL